MKLQAVVALEAADIKAAIEAHILSQLQVRAVVEVTASGSAYEITISEAEIDQPKTRKASTPKVGGAKRGRKPRQTTDVAVSGDEVVLEAAVADVPEITDAEHAAVTNPYATQDAVEAQPVVEDTDSEFTFD